MTKAYELKVANLPGLHWKKEIDQHMADPAHQLVAEFLNKDEAEFGGREQRIDAWISAVKALDPNAAASRATWHRYKNEVENRLASPRPARIVLERNAPPDEFRPFDSAIGSSHSRQADDQAVA